MTAAAQEPGLAVRTAKRTGKLLLGVFFWWVVLALAFDVTRFCLAMLRWYSPDWETGGWTVFCVPRSVFIHERLGAAIAYVATAAIGWLYVFRHRLRAVWILIALWGVSTLAVAVSGLGFAHPPSDAELEERFQREEQTFNELAAMWTEDIRAHAASPPDSSWRFDLSETREEQYRQLGARLGLEFGIFYGRKVEVEGIMISKGEFELMGCMVVKGYAYAEREPTPLVDSLDGGLEKRWGLVFKRLKGNWYLFYSRTNY